MNRREITVMVKPGSLIPSVESFGDNRFLVRLELNEHNQINLEIPKILATELGIPPKNFELISGADKNIKIFKIY
ncbi:MAG: hypothetical protein WC584_01355 [Candidatus Pacearchaeota archaeon]